ncbi:MAG: glycoside hydrolase family 127 protein, partial [Opitutaceae bacterium]|nr:glycoside hydrolase family 127 protein [Opitutaceae bacterium]
VSVLLVFPFLFASTRAELVPEKIPGVIPDIQALQNADAVHLKGWLGQRIDGNERVRLLGIDIDQRLLDVYRHQTDYQNANNWNGEHVGKWLHAATLAWVNSGDPALRAKLDLVVAELLKCQQPDGYFGTYPLEKRWTGWDLWSHKYNLIGLLTYIRHTGNQQPLEACRRMADLLCKTYGDGPGQLTINRGPHQGLAYSSVMEPMIELHRLTGEPRYLEFCHYILRAWETERGPKIISTLLTVKQVNQVANGKAYELLSCLNSVLEVYRTTGDRQLLDACLIAWTDIVENRLYLTGTSSYREYFRETGDLPNTNRVGETCVAVTWIQFNQQLLRLTGEARFAEEIECAVLNQLIGSQAPDHDRWGYYVEMEGKKPYRTAVTEHCCLSSGPRGLALIPTFAASTDADGVVVNLYEAGTAKLALRDGTAVTLATDTAYPADGRIRIAVTPSAPATFAVKLRIPGWSRGAPIRVNGTATKVTPGTDGYYPLRRAWKAGDVVELDLTMEPRLVLGDHLNTGKAAFLYGPLVLAADDALLAPEMNKDLRPLVLPSTDPKALGFTVEPASGKLATWSGAQVFRINAAVPQTSGDTTKIVPREIRLIPFGEAGGFDSRYKVWLPLASASAGNLAVEAASQPSSFIADNDVSTFGDSIGPATGEHAFTLTFERPIKVGRVVFVHGQSLDRAAWRGWFDTSGSLPEVQVRRVADGPWIKVGELPGY